MYNWFFVIGTIFWGLQGGLSCNVKQNMTQPIKRIEVKKGCTKEIAVAIFKGRGLIVFIVSLYCEVTVWIVGSTICWGLIWLSGFSNSWFFISLLTQNNPLLPYSHWKKEGSAVFVLYKMFAVELPWIEYCSVNVIINSFLVHFSV